MPLGSFSIDFEKTGDFYECRRLENYIENYIKYNEQRLKFKRSLKKNEEFAEETDENDNSEKQSIDQKEESPLF
jgi:hypothetical protein